MKKNVLKLFSAVALIALICNPKSTKAQTGAALNFDGVNDKVVIGTSATSSLVGNNKLTVEAWVRPTSTVGLGMVVGNYNSPGNSMQFMIRRQNDSWVFWVGPGNNTTYSNTPLTAGSATINVWQHVAGVFNGTVMTLYINGVASATAVTSNTFATATNSLMIGGESASEFFAGDIDEVRIWNVARSQADIQNSLSCEINGSASNLIANYHFNQGVAAGNNIAVTNAIDDSGNNFTGTLTAMNLTGATSNWVALGGVTSGLSCNGAALNFDGINDIVQIGTNLTNAIGTSSVLTAEAWVRPTTLSTSGSIISNHNSNTSFCLRRIGSTYDAFIGFGAHSVTSAANTVTLNVWQHVAMIFNGTSLSLYINGNLAGTTTFAPYTLPANSIGNATSQIGNNGFNEAFAGNIDEVRVWKSARTQCEINTFRSCEIPTNAPNLIANYHFNQGIAAGSNATVTTLNDATSNAFNGTLNTFALTGATSNWVTPGGVVSGFTTALAPPTVSFTTNPSLSICSGNTLVLSGTSANTYTWSGSVTNAVAFTPTVMVTNYTVVGTAITGCTNTAIASVSVSACSGTNAAALNFVSASGADNVALPQAISTNSLVGKTKVTVEAWVNPTSLTGLGVIVGNYATPANQLQFLLRRDNNAYSFGVGTGVSTAYNAVTTAANTSTINVWQHVAGVFDGTVIAVYINGVFSASVNATSNYTFATTTNSIIIGANAVNENYTGAIDEIRIWSTNRSKCEINTFMNCEIPTNAANLVANYHFNQGIAAAANPTVNVLSDATSNAFNGALNTFSLNGATSNWVTPGGVVSGFTTALAPVSLTINANPSLAVCSSNTLLLTGTGANTYTWTGGITNGTAFTPIASNTYTLSGTNTITSCSNIAISNVTVNTTPTVTVNSGVICAGSSFTMSPSGASTYTFSSGSAVVTPTANSSYSVTGTSAAGCVSSAPAVSSVTVNALPTPSIASSAVAGTICAGQSVSLTASGATTFSWNTGATGAVVVVNPTITTTYTVNGTSNGCSNIAILIQGVSPCTGIAQNNIQSSAVSIFPNPSTGVFTIDLESTSIITMVDVLGKIIYTQQLQYGKHNINLSNFNNGLYILKAESNGVVKTVRVVKQ